MSDLVITGASRGIGAALACERAKPGPERLVLVARDRQRLEDVAAQARSRGAQVVCVAGDLGELAGARALGSQLSELLEPGATLVHNAGLWPSRRKLNADGLEAAFALNHLGPLALQEPLLSTGKLRRIMVVSAGLIALGKVDAERTPVGGDFSPFRTYCNTKLCLAVAERDVAAAHPELDMVVLHPGVVRTDLVAREGLWGRLVGSMKRWMESPEDCGRRLSRILDRERWSPPGAPRWLHEEAERPWPAAAESEKTKTAVRAATSRFLSQAC